MARARKSGGAWLIWLVIVAVAGLARVFGGSQEAGSYTQQPVPRYSSSTLAASRPVANASSSGMAFRPVPAQASSSSAAAGPDPHTSLGDADIRQVTATSLRVRETPDATSAVLATLAHGVRIAVLSESGEWALISLSDGRFGWANVSYLGRASNDVDIPSPGSQAEVGYASSASSAFVPSPSMVPVAPSTATRRCSESGSCYGDISSVTGLPKTTFVNGYFRKNGTYVRSYFRSHR